MKVNDPNITADKVWDYIEIIDLTDKADNYINCLNKYGFSTSKDLVGKWLKSLDKGKLNQLYNDLKQEFK